MGSASPHDANDEKRYVLYRKFWRTLQNLGLWHHEIYIARKELRTVRDDKRDIMPLCVTRVCNYIIIVTITSTPVLQEIRTRYPSADGIYRDYVSTFDAENY